MYSFLHIFGKQPAEFSGCRCVGRPVLLLRKVPEAPYVLSEAVVLMVVSLLFSPRPVVPFDNLYVCCGRGRPMFLTAEPLQAV